MIIQSFASRQIKPGDRWKVYLRASDPDGKMKYIVAIVEQPGVAPYPASRIRIKEEDRKEISGYIYLNTFSASANQLNFVDLTLIVQIQDLSGHFSQAVVFPLSIQNRAEQELPPERVFLEKDLGPIMIQLGSVGP